MRVFILSLCACARIVRCVFLKVTLMVNGIIVMCGGSGGGRGGYTAWGEQGLQQGDGFKTGFVRKIGRSNRNKRNLRKKMYN